MTIWGIEVEKNKNKIKKATVTKQMVTKKKNCRTINDIEMPGKLSLSSISKSRERSIQGTKDEDNGACGFP